MANKIKLVRETPITLGSGGVALTLASLPNNQGRKSAVIDLGAGATPYKFNLRGKFEMTGVIGGSLDYSQSLEIYLVTSDNTDTDGNLSLTDDAITALQKKYNMKQIGNFFVDSSTVTIKGSCDFEVTTRYFMIAVFNHTTLALSTSTTNNLITITPIVEEVQ